MDPFLIGVIASLTATAIVTFVVIVTRPLRQLLRFETLEYELEWDSDFGPCDWDIQWETERLGIGAAQAHNDHLEDVTIRLNRGSPWVPESKNLAVSSRFIHPPNWPIGFRLRSIVRTNPERTAKEYVLVFDIRRKRKLFRVG